MMLRRLQQAGHKPIVLMGGGTTKVGDPSGKDESRKLLTDEEIDANIASIRRVFEHFLTFGDGPTDAIMVNNADWLDELEYISVPARGRAAFHDQPDADLRQRQAAARPRAAADLPRIQLHDPPGLRLPGAVAARRLPAAAGRVGPVGQYRQRHRAWPPDRRHRAVRRDDAADHHRRRRQDGQDRAGRGLAQRRPAQPLRLLAILAEHRRTPMSAGSCGCSPTCRSTRSRGWKACRAPRSTRPRSCWRPRRRRCCTARGGARRRGRPRSRRSRTAAPARTCRRYPSATA